MRTLTRPSRKLMAVTGSVALAALIAGTTLTSSAASWTDAEYDRATITALDCAAEDRIGTSTASGRILGGTLLGLDLDTIAEVRGVAATDAGSGTVPDPASAVEVPGSDGDAYQNPLEAGVLFDIINLNLTQALLKLPLQTDVGVYGQYARASDDASSAGAAGAVDQGGSINLDTTPAPPEERPGFARLELGALLEQVVGAQLSTLVAGLADLRLDIGAVASAASLDACGAAWQGDVYSGLERDYAIAGLDLEVDSGLVGDLTTTVSGTLTTLQNALNAVAGNGGVLTSVTSGLLGILRPILMTLGLGIGNEDPTISITADFSAVNALLTDTISDSQGIVEIDLETGIIGVDLSALLGEVYGTQGLNGLAPNSELLIDDEVINALVAAVGDALDEWVADVIEEIDDALDIVQVKVEANLPVTSLGADIAVLEVQIEAGLDSLLAGTAKASIHLAPRGVCVITGCIILNTLLGLLDDVVLAGLGGAVGAILGPLVGTAVAPILTSLGATLSGLTAPIVTLLASTLGVLFGSDGLVGLLVNAQNDPDPAAVGAGPEPAPWASLPGPSSGYPFASGRYDVAALRLSVIGAAQAVELELARSSVGSNVVTG